MLDWPSKFSDIRRRQEPTTGATSGSPKATTIHDGVAPLQRSILAPWPVFGEAVKIRNRMEGRARAVGYHDEMCPKWVKRGARTDARRLTAHRHKSDNRTPSSAGTLHNQPKSHTLAEGKQHLQAHGIQHRMNQPLCERIARLSQSLQFWPRSASRRRTRSGRSADLQAQSTDNESHRGRYMRCSTKARTR